MSKSVYTLAQDTDATAAARMMLRHHLKSVPAVAGDRVVGIVARRDLLRLVARDDDDDIRADLQARLAAELELLQRLRVEVADGVVSVAGAGELGRELVVGLARTVPGVVEVHSGDDLAGPERRAR